MRRGLAAVAVSLLLAGCGGSGAGEPTLTVLGASSLTEALGRYGESFPGAKVRSSFAGSDQLAAQIEQGARADVFASADTAYPAQLHRERLVGKPVVFARNRLLVVTPPHGTVESLADLTEPGTRIVIGDPSVPVGAYTREVLGRLPASEQAAILDNVRSEEPEVTAVLAKVAGGAADAGFVYATDARTVAGQVRTVPLPPRLQPDVAYAAAVVSGSSEEEDAQRYLEGLLHGAGGADLREAGFLPPR
ncbi:MAG TPA: molybdate ABC transporter substrate-binding protein [Solirubrobacterales bacterium]|nr:molybdate ABC transporter substrate-binding protein [Solirubrobacterales bacterium]